MYAIVLIIVQFKNTVWRCDASMIHLRFMKCFSVHQVQKESFLKSLLEVKCRNFLYNLEQGWSKTYSL